MNETLSNVPQSPPPSYEFVLEEVLFVKHHPQMSPKLTPQTISAFTQRHQNRLANLDKDNNPTHCPSRPRSSASVHVVENGLAACLHDTLSSAAYHQQQHLHAAADHRKRDLDVEFSFGNMTTPSQEDLLGNIDGDSMFVIENAAGKGMAIFCLYGVTFQMYSHMCITNA